MKMQARASARVVPLRLELADEFVDRAVRDAQASYDLPEEIGG
jgi:hypothetical protein